MQYSVECVTAVGMAHFLLHLYSLFVDVDFFQRFLADRPVICLSVICNANIVAKQYVVVGRYHCIKR